MIELKGVAKDYGGFEAVYPLDLQVKKGEVFGFLGPNGAGKTTTIKMLGGVMRPTRGEIVVGGLSMAKDPVAVKRLTGFIPDRPYLYEKLTAYEFMRFIAGIYQLKPEQFETRTTQLLEKFGLANWRDGLIEGFSHGMKQRLVMSAALLHDPELLIVDEPMVGLDPHGARLVKNMFREHARAGGTVFLSTHSLEVAEEVCDRVAIFRQGRILALGTMAELRSKAGREDSLETIFLSLTGGEDVQVALRGLREEAAR
jgi:ABC-2 type transport system ATP-binding protein